MANEAQANASLNFSKSGAVLAGAAGTATTVAGTKCANVTQLIPTASTVVVFGAITAVGWFIIQNLDNTNYVDIGFDNSTWPIRLKADANAGNAGGFIMAQANAPTVYAKANTASCSILARGLDL